MSDIITVLPHLNGILNSITVFLLFAAWVAIRRGDRFWHRRLMMAALGVSAVFLASYLTYHFTAPIFVFVGQGWIRPIYYTLLVAHVVLAIIVTPMVVITALRGLRAFRSPLLGPAHGRIARWTWPIWMFVAVSGVVIYAMLYHLYPAGGQ